MDDKILGLVETREQLARLLARVTDNGGATADRYSFYFLDGTVLGLSGAPTHPQGFSQWSEYDPDTCTGLVEDGTDRTVSLAELPEGIVSHAIARVNEGYRDWIESEVHANPCLFSYPRGEDADEVPVLDREWLFDAVSDDNVIPDEHPFCVPDEDIVGAQA